MRHPKIPVAAEGVPFIGFAALCTLALACLGLPLATLLALACTAFVLYFFRDPERIIPPGEHCVISPADGRILLVEPVTDSSFIEGPAMKVSIFMNVFNVHVNRAPITGQVEKVLYKPGKFHSADTVKGGLENEYCGTVVMTASGKRLAFVQIAGLIARRIVCWLDPGDSVVRGHRFGLIRFGSRVDLYLPPEATVKVKVGEKVRAGESILATLDES